MSAVSIIIPHYNTPHALERLLTSIGVHEEIEIIVIDDRSTEQLQQYETVKAMFPYVKYLVNTSTNKGAGAARNIGLNVATGTWALFADADDYYTEDFYAILQKYINSKSDIIFFPPVSIEDDTLQLSDRHIPYQRAIEQYFAELGQKNENQLRYGWAPPWSKLIRMSMIQDNEILFSEVLVSNDVMFSTKTGHLAHAIEVSKDVIYCITKSAGSLTTTISASALETRVDMTIEKYHYLKQNLPPNQFKGLKIGGRHWLVTCLEHRLGLSVFLRIFSKLRKNGVKIIYLSDFTSFSLLKKIKKAICNHRKMTRYMVKEK